MNDIVNIISLFKEDGNNFNNFTPIKGYIQYNRTITDSYLNRCESSTAKNIGIITSSVQYKDETFSILFMLHYIIINHENICYNIYDADKDKDINLISFFISKNINTIFGILPKNMILDLYKDFEDNSIIFYSLNYPFETDICFKNVYIFIYLDINYNQFLNMLHYLHMHIIINKIFCSFLIKQMFMNHFRIM